MSMGAITWIAQTLNHYTHKAIGQYLEQHEKLQRIPVSWGNENYEEPRESQWGENGHG